MTASEIIAAVREHGGDVTIDERGPRIVNGSGVPVEIVDLCREHRAAIIAALAPPEPTQLSFDLVARPAMSFLDEQDALFVGLCAEFGLHIGPYVPSRSIGAAA